MPLVGIAQKLILSNTPAICTMMSVKSQASNVVNGVKLLGSCGALDTGEKEWITVPAIDIFSFQLLMEGALAADFECEIQACVIGGEATPEVLATINSTTVAVFMHKPNEGYDRIRANVTKFKTAGLGSQVLLSGRLK